MRGGDAAGGFFRPGDGNSIEDGPAPTVRAAYSQIIEQAARAGMPGAMDMWRISPEEMRLKLLAFSAAQHDMLKQADTAAWLTGYYTALGINAPKRFPKKPNGIARREHMTDEQMKRAALAFAAKHGGGHGNGNNA